MLIENLAKICVKGKITIFRICKEAMEYFKSFISCKNVNVFDFYEQKFDLEENRKWLKDDIIYIYKKNEYLIIYESSLLFKSLFWNVYFVFYLQALI